MTNIHGLSGASCFPLGSCYTTTAAAAALSPREIARALYRHGRGDWGDVGDSDWASNERSLKEGLRLLSVYHDRKGVTFWVITESDRSLTTVLLPDDY